MRSRRPTVGNTSRCLRFSTECASQQSCTQKKIPLRRNRSGRVIVVLTRDERLCAASTSTNQRHFLVECVISARVLRAAKLPYRNHMNVSIEAPILLVAPSRSPRQHGVKVNLPPTHPLGTTKSARNFTYLSFLARAHADVWHACRYKLSVERPERINRQLEQAKRIFSGPSLRLKEAWQRRAVAAHRNSSVRPKVCENAKTYDRNLRFLTPRTAMVRVNRRSMKTQNRNPFYACPVIRC
jgi:hypothetical protein